MAYLIVNEQLGAIKVGITGTSTDRLLLFRRLGWEVAHTEKFETGQDAMAVEKAILNWWRNDLALPTYLSLEDMHTRGATETAELDMVPVHLTIERMQETANRARQATSAIT